MQLYIARLCLDCEEIHDQQTLPHLQFRVVRVYQPLGPRAREAQSSAATAHRGKRRTRTGNYSATTANRQPRSVG
jgi:hypothetical protein